MNKGQKFDICLMNPPYGSFGGDDIHFKFTEKCIQCCNNKVICVMPFALINSNTKINKKYKKILDPFIISAEEVDSKVAFKDTTQSNVGIYEFINKKISDEILIKYIDKSIKVHTLNINIFSDYELTFLEYLKKYSMQYMVYGVGEFAHFNVDCKKLNIPPTIENRKQYQLKNCKKLKDNLIYLNVNIADGTKKMGTTAHFINKNRNGNIFITKQELVNYILNRTISSGYNILGFNTIKEAENCKIALQNPLLRFTLAKLANNHSITTGCFKYVPNIDWSDPRVTTDEGLLEVCGCPKDKVKEYAEYCRKYMEEFDKNNKK